MKTNYRLIIVVLALILLMCSASTANATGYYLPWKTGTNARYGLLGVHVCGFGMDGWWAVDFFPAENQVYAMESGSITYVCRDSTQVAVRVGDNILYDHLVDTGQQIGDTYVQGQPMGALVTGSFTDLCGYASQQATAYHVHACFLPSGGQFAADGYILSTATQNWTKSGTVYAPGDYMAATWTAGLPSSAGGMFNIWDYLLAGIKSILAWALNTFLLPPGTTEYTLFSSINWMAYFISSIRSVIELTGAALSTFNWWIPYYCVLIDLTLWVVQLAISGWDFVMGLIKKIPFL